MRGLRRRLIPDCVGHRVCGVAKLGNRLRQCECGALGVGENRAPPATRLLRRGVHSSRPLFGTACRASVPALQPRNCASSSVFGGMPLFSVADFRASMAFIASGRTSAGFFIRCARTLLPSTAANRDPVIGIRARTSIRVALTNLGTGLRRLHVGGAGPSRSLGSSRLMRSAPMRAQLQPRKE